MTLARIPSIPQKSKGGRPFFTLDLRYGTEVNGEACAEKILAVLGEYSPEVQIILGVCRELFNAPDAKPIRKSGGTYAKNSEMPVLLTTHPLQGKVCICLQDTAVPTKAMRLFA